MTLTRTQLCLIWAIKLDKNLSYTRRLTSDQLQNSQPRSVGFDHHVEYCTGFAAPQSYVNDSCQMAYWTWNDEKSDCIVAVDRGRWR